MDDKNERANARYQLEHAKREMNGSRMAEATNTREREELERVDRGRWRPRERRELRTKRSARTRRVSKTRGSVGWSLKHAEAWDANNEHCLLYTSDAADD